MAEEKMMRLSLVARKLNYSIDKIVETLVENGYSVERNPNAKIGTKELDFLSDYYDSDALVVDEPKAVVEEKPAEVKPPVVEPKKEPEKPVEKQKIEIESKLEGLKVLDKIDLDRHKKKPEEVKVPEPKKPEPQPVVQAPEPKKPEVVKEEPIKKEEIKKEEIKKEEVKKEEPEVIKAEGEKLQGLKVLGKIDLPTPSDNNKKRKRKRVPVAEKVVDPRAKKTNIARNKKPEKAKAVTNQKDEITTADIKDSIKATMARMQNKGPEFGGKYRREKRRSRAEASELQEQIEKHESTTLKVTEFISASEFASLMDVSVNEIISEAMKMGMFVSINQRLDAETIQLLAMEFDYDVEFISAEDEIEVETVEVEDKDEDLVERAPIVTIMGHVDHGKTSLLDYIRTTKVASGEAGGITQHIGAYNVTISEGENKGKSITFLDTPGHEAFTAMRARGAKITDVAIIVIAADDSVMPQTREAINHAQNAGVPIVFALNKIDKEGANPNKIREDLSKDNILVESWGGKYQEQEVSAKTGIGVNDLLDKVLLEAELLELKANPNRNSTGTVIEASLDKGRGYVSTILVEKGTLKIQDIILAGQFYGRVRAMVDDLGMPIKKAGPSTPVQILGLPGAPQAGDKFNVMESDREAREIATKREQIHREQSIRAKKHITLDEIGRRKAIGTFEELNVIVKGDVDGSVEALSDSLLKLSTPEVQVRIVHKGVGQISESDVLLASAADAIVVGFQVRPSLNARKIAESEQIEIRLYSIIYDAINEIKDAMEGLLAPKEEEVVIGNIEVREVFKISKIGTVAGCYVLDGSVKRNSQVRIIREGIVVHEGLISQLKRFKDEVPEVKAGFECGLSIKNFNNIEVGDIIEAFEIKEVKRKL